MGTTQTWRATALLSDNSEQLLCQAGALDYVRRWCRRILKSWSGTTRAKVAAIVVSRWEDRDLPVIAEEKVVGVVSLRQRPLNRRRDFGRVRNRIRE